MPGCRNHGVFSGNFIHTVFIAEIFIIVFAVPVFAVSFLRTGGGFRRDLFQRHGFGIDRGVGVIGLRPLVDPGLRIAIF